MQLNVVFRTFPSFLLVAAETEWNISRWILGFLFVSVAGCAAQDAALKQHVGWSVAHEGCEVYAASDGGTRADTMVPAQQLRQCFEDVQRHNPEAYQMIKATPDEVLTQVTKEAVEADKSAFHVQENLEWVLQHEGQLPYFRSLANSGNFAAIRGKYKQLQSHNPDAVNALSTLSDSELANAINQQRVSIVADSLDSASAQTIQAYTQPTTAKLEVDTNVGDFSKTVYGTSAPAYVEAIVSSNGALVPPGLDFDGMKSQKLSAGATVVIPSLPAPGRVEALSLKAGVAPSAALSAINSLPNVRSEESKTGHIETPVKATLQNTTIASIPDAGEQWFVRAISADKVKRGDLGFLQQPVVAVVGVVDGGIDATHPLIKPVLWQLPPELATASWPSGSIGYDFYGNEPNPAEELEDSHGTHVTGIVTGRQLAKWLPVFDDAGLSNNVGVFSLKVAGADGTFDFTAAQNAIEAGIVNNIHIFNLSLYGPYSQLLQQDLSRPDRINSVLFVIAAGNQSTDLDTAPDVHRTFRNSDSSGLANTIFVGALADTGTLADFSNSGKTLVEIAAPGVEISSTIHPSTFGTLSGTSQAAPFVTFTAAILKAEKPDMVPLALKNRILNTCDWDENLKGVANGCRLNLLKAVISGSDLVEMQNGTLLRGDVDRQQFFPSGATDLSLVRVWLPKSGPGSLVYSSRKREQKALAGSLAITPHDGEVCPHPVVGGKCKLTRSEVRDVIFRVK